MSWGCYKHECDVDSPSWLEKEEALCVKHSEREKNLGVSPPTWGSRQIGICPWCVEEYLESNRKLLEALESVCRLCRKVSADEGIWIDVYEIEQLAAKIKGES